MKFKTLTTKWYDGAVSIAELQLKQSNKIVCKVGVNYGRDNLCLYWSTSEEYIGKGYGKKTLTEFIRIAREKDITRLHVRIASNNTSSISLAKSCGFTEFECNWYGIVAYELIL